MTYLAYAVAVLLAGLGGYALYMGWSTVSSIGQLQKNEAILLTQIGVTFISGIAIALLTAAFARSNETLKSELTKSTEELKNRLARETGTAITTLNSELMKSVEGVKAGLTKVGDEFRAELGQVVPRRHGAYHGMWAAASQYFSALQKFEAGVFAEDELKAANTACEVARGQALLADNEDEGRFDAFWQEMHFIFEKGEQRKGTLDGIRSLWLAEGRGLGDKHEELRDAFAKKLLG